MLFFLATFVQIAQQLNVRNEAKIFDFERQSLFPLVHAKKKKICFHSYIVVVLELIFSLRHSAYYLRRSKIRTLAHLLNHF